MSINKFLNFALGIIVFISGCGINSVTKAEIEKVKAGNVVTYRYRKGDKEWFYADKIVRVEGDTVYYNASKSESTKGNDGRLRDFDTTQELSMKKADLLKYETEQGDEMKKIIWIE
ncbi:MAG: hypothetical protein ACJ72Z_07680 [Pyrinomonadaceae bacterium]